MLRLSYLSLALVTALGLTNVRDAYSQIAPPGSALEPTDGNGPVRRNSYEPTKAVAAINKIMQPVPLSASERDTALEGIDRHVADEVASLKAKLKTILPDELSVLSKTVGWNAEKQNNLLVALRAGDPAAVYEAWTQGSPQDTAGAELAARQVDVRRACARLEQDIQHHQAINQDLADLETSLTKIAASTPSIADLATAVSSLKTWSDVRKLVESAVPENGPTARLPSGRVQLIFDPNLAIGQAVVMSNGAVMIGNHGRGPVSISMGNAAEALGLPIVTGKPVPDAQGWDVSSGVLLANRPESRATVNYTVNGNAYVMQPGMAQRLDAPGPWTVTYDRGENMGTSTYSVADGTYWFTPTDGGLQLYRERFDVVLDNEGNAQEFNYLLNGQKMTVPANATRTISSAYPMVIRYDRGNGTDLATKMLNFDGNVEIGVNAADNMWDIFPTTEGQREGGKLRLFQ